METVVYVFTDIPLLFGQPQPFLFLKKWLKVIPEYGRTEAQSWP